MEQQGIKGKAILVIGIGLIAVSFASIFIKLCQAPALVIAAYRLALASLFYLGFSELKYGHSWRKFSASQIKVIIISSIFLTIHFATWISSLKYTSVASSVILVQSAPVFVALGSFVFLKERPTMLMLLGAIIALSGTILISVHDYTQNNVSLTGNLLALCGAVGAAGYLLAGRKLRAELKTFPYVSAVYSVTALILVLLAMGSGAPFFNYDLKTYLLFFALALIPQVIGHTSINWSLKYFSATAVSIIILGEPIGASILAMAILVEKLTWFKIFGSLIILCGVILALTAEAQVQKRTR